MNSKVLIGGLAGGVASFILGYLVWGLGLHSFYEANSNQCMALPMEEMIWWSLIAFNITWGLLIAFVLYWAGSFSFADGLVKGAILGFLISLTIDLSFYSFSTMFTGGLTIVAVDVAVNTVVTAVLGGLVAAVMAKV